MSNKKTNKKNKILAVSSFGGHWVQLLRIVQPLEQDYDISYICTNKKSSTMAHGKHVYNIMDFFMLVINSLSNLWLWLTTQIEIAGYDVKPITLVFGILIFAGIIRAVL